MGYQTASIGLTRDVNRSAVLRLIGIAGPIARTTIAARLGLSPATVTASTRELIDQPRYMPAEYAAILVDFRRRRDASAMYG